MNTNTYFVFNCNVLALFTFYAVPSSGKHKCALVHWLAYLHSNRLNLSLWHNVIIKPKTVLKLFFNYSLFYFTSEANDWDSEKTIWPINNILFRLLWVVQNQRLGQTLNTLSPHLWCICQHWVLFMHYTNYSTLTFVDKEHVSFQ